MDRCPKEQTLRSYREGYATVTALAPTAAVEMNLPFQGWYEEIDQEG